MKTAQQASANWTASAGRAVTAYTDGVANTQKDQAALAVASEARLVQNFNAAVAAGRWRNGITRGGTPYWKTQTQKKAGNYSTGFVAGEGNFNTAIAKVMAAIQTGVQALPPRGDVNANIERVRSLDLYLHSLKGQLGAR